MSDPLHITLRGALCVQRGTPMLQAYIDPLLLRDQGKVDVHDPEADTGYQRSLVTSRIKQTADYYQKGGRMPNPLLANVRDEDFGQVEVIPDGGAVAEAAYNEAVENGGNWIGNGRIEFDSSLDLWVYDGQHRRAGLTRIIDGFSGFEDFPVPISVTLGLSTQEEMIEFYQVNTNAKNVSTNLAFTLLSKMSENDPDLRDALESSDRDWITRGQSVMKELEVLDGPWSGRFQPANTRKKKGDGKILPMPQFVRSLKPVLDMPLLKRAEASTVASVVNAYWTGISQVLPEAFDNPEDYQIQKGQGTVALHRVLPQVIEVIRSRGARLGDPDSYSDVMADLPDLEGVNVDADGNKVTVAGAEYWKTGSVASAFSGDAGRRRLASLIQTLLPKPSDTLEL